ncbi:MAG: YIP1 family protein [Pseudomonadota bacterium]
MNPNTAAVKSYFKGLMDLAIKLIAGPVDFFRNMPKNGGLLDPMLFLVTTVLLGVILIFAGSFVTHGTGVYGLGMLAISLIIMPLIAIILSFFVAGIFYVTWSFMGSNESYETSYRCLAYTQILFPLMILLSIVPYLALLGIAWWFYLMVVATREVHKAPAAPAAAVFGAIAVLIGLVYYSSVSSTIKAKQRLEEYTKELQKAPAGNEKADSGNR